MAVLVVKHRCVFDNELQPTLFNMKNYQHQNTKLKTYIYLIMIVYTIMKHSRGGSSKRDRTSQGVACRSRYVEIVFLFVCFERYEQFFTYLTAFKITSLFVCLFVLFIAAWAIFQLPVTGLQIEAYLLLAMRVLLRATPIIWRVKEISWFICPIFINSAYYKTFVCTFFFIFYTNQIFFMSHGFVHTAILINTYLNQNLK